MKKKKPEIWWTIASGTMLISCFSTTRKGAIKDFIGNDILPEKWENYQARGYRVVKVLVQEAK